MTTVKQFYLNYFGVLPVRDADENFKDLQQVILVTVQLIRKVKCSTLDPSFVAKPSDSFHN